MLTTALLTCALIGQVRPLLHHDDARNMTAELYWVPVYKESDHAIEFCFGTGFNGRARPPLTDSAEVNFSANSSSDEWQFLRFSDAILVRDGVSVPLVVSSNTRDVRNGGVRETFNYEFTLADLKKLVGAKEVKFAIGTTSCTLDDTQKAGLREVFERLTLPTGEWEARQARAEAEKAKVAAQRQAEEERMAADKEAEAEKIRKVAENEKRAASDVAMAKRFLKMDKPDVAKEWAQKALDRNPKAESVRKEAEEILKGVTAKLD